MAWTIDGNALATSETFACHNFHVMIHVGIRCSECGRVHFVLGLKRLTKTSTEGVYQITCISPCGAITFFRIEDTRAFAVPDHLYGRGYAEPGEYEPSQIA
jgi:hypothetical protein